MLEKINLYLQYPFVVNALIVGVLISLCASLLGIPLVLKRYSFIGQGLSNVAFGSMAIATIFKVTDDMLVILPITIVSAILLLRMGQNSKTNSDAAVAMVSVGSMAVGYLLISIFSTSSNRSADVCSTLFGSTSILTISNKELILSLVLSILSIIVFTVFYNKIFSISFDEDFTGATGTNVELYKLMIATVIAVVIVLAMNLVGSLLISALIIFPVLSSMRIFDSYKSVVISSVIFSVVCAVIGIFAAIIAGTPVGSTIVTVDIFGYIIFSVLSYFKRG